MSGFSSSPYTFGCGRGAPSRSPRTALSAAASMHGDSYASFQPASPAKHGSPSMFPAPAAAGLHKLHDVAPPSTSPPSFSQNTQLTARQSFAPPPLLRTTVQCRSSAPAAPPPPCAAAFLDTRQFSSVPPYAPPPTPPALFPRRMHRRSSAPSASHAPPPSPSTSPPSSENPSTTAPAAASTHRTPAPPRITVASDPSTLRTDTPSGTDTAPYVPFDATTESPRAASASAEAISRFAVAHDNPSPASSPSSRA